MPNDAPPIGLAVPRARRGLELVLLFVLPPVALWLSTAVGRDVPPLLVLLAVTALALVALASRGRSLLRLLERRGSAAELRRCLALFGGAALLVPLFVVLVAPERLAELPTRHPGAWALVMLTYPLASVLPQEFVYRVFLFERYGPLLPTAAARVSVSALLFGLAHVVYGVWPSVLLSTLGGLLFAWTYARSRCLWLAVAEHTLYGWLVLSVAPAAWFFSRAYEPPAVTAPLVGVEAPRAAGEGR